MSEDFFYSPLVQRGSESPHREQMKCTPKVWSVLHPDHIESGLIEQLQEKGFSVQKIQILQTLRQTEVEGSKVEIEKESPLKRSEDGFLIPNPPLKKKQKLATSN